MVATIKVGKIAAAAGTTVNVESGHLITGAAGSIVAPGHVIQVLSAGMNTSKSTTSTSFVATTHSVTITPKFNDSKVFLNVSGGSWYVNAGETWCTFYRDSTNLGHSTYGLTESSQTGYNPHSFSFVDSPTTTSAITYEVYFRVSNSSNTSYYSYPNYGTVYLTAMEIAQ
tara:strand:+ start:476 stop:985 length:510 start_codon:yes stop_codon:yes gene_type:complete